MAAMTVMNSSLADKLGNFDGLPTAFDVSPRCAASPNITKKQRILMIETVQDEVFRPAGYFWPGICAHELTLFEVNDASRRIDSIPDRQIQKKELVQGVDG